MPEGPLVIEAESQSSVKLSWKPSLCSMEYTPEYHIQVRKDDAEWIDQSEVKDRTECVIQIADVRNLQYAFRVYSQNSGGRSPPLTSPDDFDIKGLFCKCHMQL